MRRTAPILLALVLFAAACGDDDASPSGTSGSSTTSPASSSSTAATTTTAAPTTTEAETTTTAAALSGPEAYIAASADQVGEYFGTWTNETFGSSGALYINVVEANTEAGFVLIQVDADGNAFGAADPDLFTVEIFTAGDSLDTGFSDFLGDWTFQIDDAGNFIVEANPPLLGGLVLQVEGSITPDGFSGTYVIPDLANGTWNAFVEM